MLTSKPARGKAHTAGKTCMTTMMLHNKPVQVLLDGGAYCSVVSSKYLEKVLPDWQENLLPIQNMKLNSFRSELQPLGVIENELIVPHPGGSIRLKLEFVVMYNSPCMYFILGNEFQTHYGIDITNSKERYFTIGN